MADLDRENRSRAQIAANVRLLPVGVEDNKDIENSQRWGGFEPGDWVVITSPVDFHVNAGDETVEAAATNPPLPAGVHDFVVPSGATYVALLGAAVGSACVFKAG